MEDDDDLFGDTGDLAISDDEEENNNVAQEQDDGDEEEASGVYDGVSANNDDEEADDYVGHQTNGFSRKHIAEDDDDEDGDAGANGSARFDEGGEFERSRGADEDGEEEDQRDGDEERLEEDGQQEADEDDERYRRREIVDDLSLPSLARPIPAEDHPDNPYLAKLPSFLSVDSHAFDRDAFARELAEKLEDGSVDDVEYLQMQLQLENTIRWRYASSQGARKETNARLIRWSDNSFSLLLGSEIFDIPIKHLAPASHQYLVAEHEPSADATVLETLSRFTQMFMFAPSSSKSTTHQRLKSAIAIRNQKKNKTKLFAKTVDPEALRREAEKVAKEQAKYERKLAASRRKKEEEFYGTGPDRYERTASSFRDNMYEEEDLDDADFSDAEAEERLRQSKRMDPAELGKRKRSNIYSDDSEDEEEDEEGLDEYEKDDFLVDEDEDAEASRREKKRQKKEKAARDRVSSAFEETVDVAEEAPSAEAAAAASAALTASAAALRRRMVIDSDEED